MPLDNTTLNKLIESSQLVPKNELTAAHKVSTHLNCLVSDVLLGRGLITEPDLGNILEKYYNVPFINLKQTDINSETIKLLPENMAASRKAIIFHQQNQTVHLAMEDPHDIELIEIIKKTLGPNYKITPFVATHTGIKNALNIYKQSDDKTDLNIKKNDVSVIAEIEKLLDHAVRESASDIHIEILEDNLLARFRIDGVLHDQAAYPKEVHPAFIARIKILSDLKLDETRLPQDGQFSYLTKTADKVSFRVSVIPTVHGEKVVLRLLESVLTRFNLEELGLLPEDQEIASRVLGKTHGMFLVTGPTGSGKTTSLYTFLSLLNKPNVNIITIEDPVENRLRRVNQIQVNSAINLTFANGLRSILRQDPDIIMVGEIRDHETSIIATNAAMTGHLVFSTIHANTAAGAIPRMIDLGVEPFLLASTINMVIAQRLIRVLCPKCKQKTKVDPLMAKKLNSVKPHISKDIFKMVTHNYQAPGCIYCYNTGYKGRIGIFELININDQIKKLINEKKSSAEIWAAARKDNSKSMLEDGFIKVSRGIAPLEEIFRVISE